MSMLMAKGVDEALEEDLPTAELAPPALPRVDLLPPEIRERRRLRRVQTGLGGAVLGSVGVAALLYLSAAGAVQDAQTELDEATAQGAALRTEQAQYAGVVETRQRAEAARAVLAQAMGDEVRFSALLGTLGRSTPDGVWLRDVTLTQTGAAAAPAAGAPAAPPATAPAATALTGVGTVTLTARGFDHDDVAAWLESLATAPGFADTSFSTATESLLGGRKVVEFTGTATLTAEALSGRYVPKAG